MPAQETVNDPFAYAYDQMAAAIDLLEITGHPPKVPKHSHKYLIAAIKDIHGPDVNAERHLQDMLTRMLFLAKLCRTASQRRRQL